MIEKQSETATEGDPGEWQRTWLGPSGIGLNAMGGRGRRRETITGAHESSYKEPIRP